MKIYNYFILLIILQSGFVFAQTGIGTKTPDASSVLDVSSSTKGLLLPRMSSSERDLIKNPANALIIYNNTLGAIEVNVGTKSNPNWTVVGSDETGKSTFTKISAGALWVGDDNGFAKEVMVTGDMSFSGTGLAIIDNDAVISKTLTGYKTGSGPITAADNILQAIQKLEGNQSISTIVSTTKNYNVLLTDYTIICDAETGPLAINLPEASSSPSKIYVIKKIDETSNELNINPPIQLTKKITVSQLNYPKSFKIQSDGKVWNVIN